MTRKTRIQAGETVGLKLTTAERDRLFEGIDLVPEAVAEVIRAAPPSKPVLLTIADLGRLATALDAETGRHHEEPKALRALVRIRKKVEALLDQDAVEPPSAADTPIRLAEPRHERRDDEGPSTLPLPSTTKRGEETVPLRLTETQREALIETTRLRRALKTKLGKVSQGTQEIGFTIEELEELHGETEFAVQFDPSPSKKRLIAVVEKLEDLLDGLQDEPDERGRTIVAPTDRIYQLKVTLKDIKPPIWRRLQVPDCTLGELHEILQVAFGWTHSHLHQFVVRGEYYGPVEPDDLGFGVDMEVEDEEGLLLSQILADGKKVRFVYEYDFGDGWRHEIQSERFVAREPKVSYPRCIDGARSGPPEDVGGPWGFAEFVEAMGDPKHENHRQLKEWHGGRFDPEKFSIEGLNKTLKKYT